MTKPNSESQVRLAAVRASSAVRRFTKSALWFLLSLVVYPVLLALFAGSVWVFLWWNDEVPLVPTSMDDLVLLAYFAGGFLLFIPVLLMMKPLFTTDRGYRRLYLGWAVMSLLSFALLVLFGILRKYVSPTDYETGFTLTLNAFAIVVAGGGAFVRVAAKLKKEREEIRKSAQASNEDA